MRNEKYGVSIFGGGPSGMSATLGLPQAGRRVPLLEREPGLGGLRATMDRGTPAIEDSADTGVDVITTRNLQSRRSSK